jgi:flagellar protein FliL
MADDQYDEVEQEEASDAKKKKGPFKLILIILIVLLIGGGAGYFFFGKTLVAKYMGKQTAVKEEKKVEVGPTVALEPFLINVSGATSRYVKISVAIEVSNEKAIEHTKKLTPVIRDRMLTVLGSKAQEIFLDNAGRNTLKKELSDAVAPLFEKKIFKGVYITDIIMQ